MVCAVLSGRQGRKAGLARPRPRRNGVCPRLPRSLSGLPDGRQMPANGGQIDNSEAFQRRILAMYRSGCAQNPPPRCCPKPSSSRLSQPPSLTPRCHGKSMSDTNDHRLEPMPIAADKPLSRLRGRPGGGPLARQRKRQAKPGKGPSRREARPQPLPPSLPHAHISTNTNGGHLEPMGPFSVADRSDAVWLRDDFVPGFAAVVEDVVIALEDAV